CLLAHHVGAEGSKRHEEAQVNARPLTSSGCHKFGKALPLPRDSFRKDVKRRPLDVDQVPSESLALLRAAGGDAHPAVAHYYGGDSVPGGAGHQGVPPDLRVIMRVGINKAWHHAQVCGVAHLGSPGGDLADLHDSAIGHRHVRMALWAARAVYHSSRLNEQIIGHVRSSLCYASHV